MLEPGLVQAVELPTTGMVMRQRILEQQGFRMLSSSGTGEVNAKVEEVRPRRGRPSKLRHSSVKLEATTSTK